jgi:3-methyladenine DNA glycosylase/8-oxoguanine DNA glycosylase
MRQAENLCTLLTKTYYIYIHMCVHIHIYAPLGTLHSARERSARTQAEEVYVPLTENCMEDDDHLFRLDCSLHAFTSALLAIQSTPHSATPSPYTPSKTL